MSYTPRLIPPFFIYKFVQGWKQEFALATKHEGKKKGRRRKFINKKLSKIQK